MISFGFAFAKSFEFEFASQKKLITYSEIPIFLQDAPHPLNATEAYVKLEQLGEGSYAVVYKGLSL